jgi:hypothetical protein
MTTDRQIAANRQNAQHSTGPRTPEGKAAASRNNTRHGLKAASPVIPKLESPEDWEQHRQTTAAGLNPGNALEEALAERIALILWRLDRIVRYEREVTAVAQDHAVVDLARGAEDVARTSANTDLLAARTRYNEARRRVRVLSIVNEGPEDTHLTGKDAASAIQAIAEQIPRFVVETFYAPEILPNNLDYEKVPDWTADRLWRFITAIAEANERDPAVLLGTALATARVRRDDGRIACRRLTREVRDLRRQRVLPKATNLAQVVKYETHLMRQFSQILGHLKQLQHQREAARLRVPYNDYHQPIDFAPFSMPADPDPGADELPVLPQHPEPNRSAAEISATPTSQHPRLDHSNPNHSESDPEPAPDCANPAPFRATISPDCTHPDHRSLDNNRG